VLADPSDRTSFRRVLDRVWARYVTAGELDGARPEIARSWRRARDVYRIDPRLARAPVVATDDLWRRRLVADEVFLAARPVLDAFSERLRDAGHVLAFVDSDGFILSVGGDPRTLEAAAEINFSAGASWREEATGTAGPGTSLADRAPIEVFASEHFVEAWHPWTTAAAPLLAIGSDRPSGLVAIAAPWDAPSPQGLLAATAIAAAVTERLRARRGVRDALVRYALHDARDGGEAVLAVDAGGAILDASDAARRTLGLEAGELPRPVRERLLAAIAVSRDDDLEVQVEWGEERRRVACAVVRHEGAAVGGVPWVAPLTTRAGRGGGAAARPAGGRDAFAAILGRSEPLRRAVDLARVAARNDLPVVISGESGTGKELFAQGIHAASPRAGKRLVALNCGAIPTSLIEAELFGYEPGTFTGGQREGKAGKLEEASGGTLFLDEVSELPPQAQTALLRVLQESEVVRLGGSRARPVDVRIVAATNRRLDDDVASGRFRNDLYFRLNVLSIPIPPLRDRPEDVPLLARHFLVEAEERIGRTGLDVSAAALEVLARHRWPGNVRELRNVILRAAAVVATPPIEPGDLLLSDLPGPAPRVRALVADDRDRRLPGAERAEAQEDAEPGRDELVAALDASGWNIVRTASSLGVSRMTLYRRLRKFGITR
jgi:sigma-54 dependent transcriptional regulator, acetoin dehydrogenase operon transcriptional activator AcoR